MLTLGPSRLLPKLLMLAFGLSLSSLCFAQSKDAKNLAIEAQPLSSALIAIGKAFSITVIASDQITAGVTAPDIKGAMTPSEALTLALAATDLTVESQSATTYVVREQNRSDRSRNDTPDDLVIEEIIVVGQKIERSLQDTASSVAVFNAEFIDQQNFIALQDILNQTANVATAFDGGIITIRGIQNVGAGENNSTSNVSAVYIDDVFLAPSLFTSGALNLWDIESVEIFRGPQSTIQGRNALAGAIVLRTKDPAEEFDASFQTQYGEYDSWRLSGAASVPVSDTFGLRFAVDELRSDGFIENPVLMSDTTDASETTTFRAKALWKPAGVDDLRIALNYSYIDAFRGDGRVIEAEFPPDRINRSNLPSRRIAEGDIVSLIVNYGLGDQWTLTSVTAYTESFNDFFQDATRDETGGASAQQFLRDDEIASQEFRLNFDGERMRGLLGTFLYNQQANDLQDRTLIVGTDSVLPDPITIARLLFGTAMPTPEQIGQAAFIRQRTVDTVPSFPVVLDRSGELEINNWALFGELDYAISDQWTLTLGLRYDNEDIRQNNFDSTSVPRIETGDPIVDQVLDLLGQTFTNVVDIPDVDNEFDAWLPKAVLTYAWTDNISTAFSYQRGYRAGGLSINSFRGALSPENADQETLEMLGVVNSYEPEFTNNYEIAYRSRFRENRLTLNANLFYIDYTDQHIGVQLSSNPTDRLTSNVGESELYGLEVEVSYLATDGLVVGANLGYVRSEFTEGRGILDDVIGGGLDLTGKEFAFAPRWTGGAFARYEWASRWFVNGRVRYTDESFSRSINDLNAINDSRTVFDFIAGFQAESWRAELFVNNAFDEEYFSSNSGPSVSAAFNSAGRPQFFGGRVVANF